MLANHAIEMDANYAAKKQKQQRNKCNDGHMTSLFFGTHGDLLALVNDPWGKNLHWIQFFYVCWKKFENARVECNRPSFMWSLDNILLQHSVQQLYKLYTLYKLYIILHPVSCGVWIIYCCNAQCNNYKYCIHCISCTLYYTQFHVEFG